MIALKYLGKQTKIRSLLAALSGERKALHPVQLSRETGLDMFEVQRCLEGCPELFVKLPRNPDGLVRWRLTSTSAIMAPEVVDRLIDTRARSEQLQVTAITVILVSFALVMLLTVVPATSLGLG